MVEAIELLQRRKVEMGYFRESMLSPETLEETARPEHFRAMVALATSEYQVSVTELAESLQVSEEEVRRWGDNSRDDLEVPSQNIREKVIGFFADDIGKKLKTLH